ncbi:MAG: type III pantothenate kinase [Streptosporangiales bacterium]|nr:type III pantothenate kinase [Streptosporangiales bacterium]
MLLTIDVGNSNTVLGLFEGQVMAEKWRIATDPLRTADELAVVLQGLLAQYPEPGGAEVTGISLCSTVPNVLQQVRQLCNRYFADVSTVIVEPGVKTGVPIKYDNPREVGADRIMNTLAAHEVYGGPAIVVDFGTSTNFDVVSDKGEFLGGALAPGIDISVDALAGRAAQLLKVELRKPRSVVGKSTVEALQSGILYGFVGLVDGIVARMIAELGLRKDDVTVIATGGLAPVVVAESRTITVHDPWLTLVGLRLVWERNVGSEQHDI